MKKLIFLSAFLSPYRSGAEAMVEEVSQRLAHEFDITIVTARLSKKLSKRDMLGNVKVIRVGFGLPIDKWLYPFLAPLQLGRLKPDIIHAVLETFAGLALFFCRCKAKKILTLQTTNRSFLKKMILRYPKTVTGISSALVDIAASYGRKDVVLIPNGIDLSAIQEACTQYTKVSGRILFVGRLEKMKGVDTLLRALSPYPSPEGRGEDIFDRCVHLHIVGDGSERERLEALAQELGLSDRVVFCGRLTGVTLFREYAEAEIFCGLSRSEALGNVFIEAEAAGCAVIGTNVGGIPDIVQDKKTGILIPVDNIEAAAAAIQALSQDADVRQMYTIAGKKNAEAYDWSSIASRYRTVYATVLQ
jgi:glycosyltransferase involved in cell wall biosynthesis